MEVLSEAWREAAYLAGETFAVVVHGSGKGPGFPTQGFVSIKDVAVFAILCLCNLVVFQVAKVSRDSSEERRPRSPRRTDAPLPPIARPAPPTSR